MAENIILLNRFSKERQEEAARITRYLLQKDKKDTDILGRMHTIIKFWNWYLKEHKPSKKDIDSCFLNLKRSRRELKSHVFLKKDYIQRKLDLLKKLNEEIEKWTAELKKLEDRELNS